MNIQSGATYRFIQFSHGAPLTFCRRLMSLGISPGTQITVLHRSPLFGPWLLECEGYTFSIRKDDLAYMVLELLN